MRDRRPDEDFAAEIESHIALETDRLIAQGLGPDDARDRALRTFGNATRVRERFYESRRVMWLEHLRQDVRYALRTFARAPLFASIAIVSLAVGIGADTTIFSVANALLLRPPAGVNDHDALVAISATNDQRFGVNEISFPDFVDLRERLTTLTDPYGYDPLAQPMALSTDGGAERVFGHRVTPNYFSALGVRPAIGQVFDPSASSADTVVLSHRFWVRRFNSDPSIVGSTVSFNNRATTIVGVAAETFTGTSLVATDVWTPIETVPFAGSFLTRRGLGWALVGGRLKPGVSLGQAAAEADTIARALEREYPETNAGRGVRVAHISLLPGNLSIPLAGVLTLLLGFVSLVLVIACANLAGLLLTRAVSRRREIAVRVAIGAGRGRLICQLLTEVSLLFAAGGVLGTLLAYALTSAVDRLLPLMPMPFGISLALDARVLAFTAGLSLVAAVVCGLVPARQSSKADVVAALKDDVHGAPRRSRLRDAFVVCQVAASVVLVAATAVFVRALDRATRVDPGFDARGVELVTLDLALAGYNSTTGPRVIRDLADRVRAIPGVEAASVAASMPTGGSLRLGVLTHPGSRPGGGSGQILAAEWNAIEPDYFTAMRVPIVRGRRFIASDTDGAANVAIVSEQAAERFWPGQDPIGKYLLQHPSDLRRGAANEPRALMVIGVAGDIKLLARDIPRAHIYLPLQQQFVGGVTVIARTAGDARLAREIHAAVRAVDPNLPIVNSDTLEHAAAFALLPQRVAAGVSASLGVVGLLLAAMGIYGVAAFAVAQRTREIGVRVALGAQRREVVRLVVRQAAALTVAGCGIGLTAAALTHLTLTRVSFGFPAFDPWAFAAAMVVFVTVGVAASYLPVRRALALDPVATLRYE